MIVFLLSILINGIPVYTDEWPYDEASCRSQGRILVANYRRDLDPKQYLVQYACDPQ